MTLGDYWTPAFDSYNGAGFTLNFGQQPFTYTPPSGYKALCTTNLPDSTIVKGNQYMDAVAYSGSNSSQTVTNGGSFYPDFTWAKSRSGAYNNILVDSIRGGNLYLVSNSTAADATSSGLASWTSSGITWIGGASGVNASGDTYVNWMWKAGAGTTTSNTSGTITSTISVNPTAGFSIITYTGNGVANATVGHGLGVQPNLIIVKQRTGNADNWAVSVKLSNLTINRMYLNSNIADNGLDWVGASSTLLTLKLTDNFLNTNGNTYVSYCWASISGFSKIGYYTGNGSTDGTFVYTGFRPKFIMIKNTAATQDWDIRDTSRDTYNASQYELYANQSSAEVNSGSRSPTNYLDILSNGFKLRGTNPETNNSGTTYIYAAFAENPFKNALAR